MNKEDAIADIEMYFRQIISMSDLMLNNHEEISPNILIIRDIAQAGLDKFISINEL